MPYSPSRPPRRHGYPIAESTYDHLKDIRAKIVRELPEQASFYQACSIKAFSEYLEPAGDRFRKILEGNRCRARLHPFNDIRLRGVRKNAVEILRLTTDPPSGAASNRGAPTKSGVAEESRFVLRAVETTPSQDVLVTHLVLPLREFAKESLRLCQSYFPRGHGVGRAIELAETRTDDDTWLWILRQVQSCGQTYLTGQPAPWYEEVAGTFLSSQDIIADRQPWKDPRIYVVQRRVEVTLGAPDGRPATFVPVGFVQGRWTRQMVVERIEASTASARIGDVRWREYLPTETRNGIAEPGRQLVDRLARSAFDHAVQTVLDEVDGMKRASTRTDDGGSSCGRPSRLEINGYTAVLDGTHHELERDQMRFLEALYKARGHFVSAKEMAIGRGVTRLMNKLPKPIQAVIETRPGAGSRLTIFNGIS